MSPVDADGVVRCKCDEPAVLLKSNTPANPGRKFYKCSKNQFDSQNCKFFQWEDELFITVKMPITPTSSPQKRPLQHESSQDSVSSSRSMVLPSTPHTQSNNTGNIPSSPETLCGSPSKKPRYSQNPTPSTPSSSVKRGFYDSDLNGETDDNLFLDQSNTPLPSTSIFAPCVSPSRSPSKGITTEEVIARGNDHHDLVNQHMKKLENRLKATQQQSDRFKKLYEDEKRNNATKIEELKTRVKELEAKNASLESTLADLGFND